MQYYYYYYYCCSTQEEALDLRLLFYNLSTSFFLVFFFISISSILLFNFFYFLGTPLFPRNEYGYEYTNTPSEEDEDEEEEEVETTSSFLDKEAETDPMSRRRWQNQVVVGVPDEELFIDLEEPWIMKHSSTQKPDNSSVYASPQASEPDDDEYYDQHRDHEEDDETVIISENHNEKYLVYEPTNNNEKYLVKKEEEEEEIFGDSCTVGSTSKSSSEWRSSINNGRDSEDPFSSSSRRSCPKWESYTIFQKYDEEMMFLDRITAQKLHETESLRAIRMCPRSISERIVHKLSTINDKKKKKQSSEVRRSQNPYYELEAAYVAQICLTWEALNWNYKNFMNKKLGGNYHKRSDLDSGCPGKIAQQFQQFQVLLERYIENEPYEHGRRPEIYGRMRLLAPNLLQVPEYLDLEDDQEKEGGGGGPYGSRISSPSFLMIMEDGIRTYMRFLKADKEKACQIVASFFKRNKRASVDPTLLQLMKKLNQKKRIKLKELRRAGKCLRKRKLTVEEEMEILMGLIDLKVVSRVLRTAGLSEEQLHWCEAKMSKVRIADGKLHRDSSPIFFPAH